MSSAPNARKRFAFLGLFAGITASVLAQNAYVPQGDEYPIAGYLRADQIYPQISVGTNGGYIVWQDNVTDGDGAGISARRLDANFIGRFGVFRVDEQGADEQENPRVALLKDGGAVFVWQGGRPGFQHIYARFLKADGTFATGDRLVNTYTENHQIDPTVAVLAGGKVVVAWASYGQDGDMYGVYGQLFSAAGEKLSPEFQVSQSISLNQRSPSISALPDGGFVLAWVSERLSSKPLSNPEGTISVLTALPRYTADIVGRAFDADGAPRAGEFRMSGGNDTCANPVISASKSGGFVAAWSQKDGLVFTNSWDVYARSFGPDALPGNAAVRLNTFTLGDQIAPKIALIGSDYLVVWTSVGQDSSREEVYGRFYAAEGGASGDEFRVNTTTVSQQIHPAVASDGASRFVAVWTSFIGGNSSFDLFAQRYAASPALPTPVAPFVYAPFVVGTDGIYQPQLLVSWPSLSGFPLANYEVFVDGGAAPSATTSENFWTLNGIAPGSTHSLQLDYLMTDGHRSPRSPSVTGTAWSGANYGGVPFEWMTTYFGPNVLTWPKPTDDSDGDGATVLQEFLAGTVPTDPNSVMRVQLVSTAQGTRLSWNAQPGFVYQVQMSSTMEAGSWAAVDTPRFAAGTSDSLLLNETNGTAYFRVIRLR